MHSKRVQNLKPTLGRLQKTDYFDIGKTYKLDTHAIRVFRDVNRNFKWYQPLIFLVKP